MILAAGSGILLAACFPRFAAYPLAFVALVPLGWVATGSPAARRFALGWVTGAFYYLVTFRWALPTIAHLQDLSILGALPFFGLFLSFHALQIALFALLAFAPRLRGTVITAPLLVASSWVVTESVFPRIIPWYLGDPLAASPVLRQAAAVGGVYGLGFLTALVNGAIVSAAISRRVRSLILPAILVAVTVVYGFVQTRQRADRDISSAAPSPTSSTPVSVRVTVVQGNLGPSNLDLDAANEVAWQAYEMLTRIGPLSKSSQTAGTESDATISLLVWPETVLRAYMRDDGVYSRRVANLVEDLDASLLLGALDRDQPAAHEYNSAFLFSPWAGASHVGDPQVYRKRRLVSFGESVPLNLAKPLEWQTTGDFVAGDSSDPINLQLQSVGPPIPFAISICFEAVFPGAFNDSVRSGAGFLVNVTDDGWFGDSDEPYQHLNGTILRAVETRRWLVRASNSGVSAFIDPTGEIVAAIPLHQSGVLTRTTKTGASLTPYVRFGDWPLGLSVSVLAVFALWQLGGHLPRRS